MMMKQSFLCKFGFSPFFMKFYEKKMKFQKCVIDHPRKNLEISSAARGGRTHRALGSSDDIKTSFNYRNFSF